MLQELKTLLDKYRSTDGSFDCVVPGTYRWACLLCARAPVRCAADAKLHVADIEMHTQMRCGEVGGM